MQFKIFFFRIFFNIFSFFAFYSFFCSCCECILEILRFPSYSHKFGLNCFYNKWCVRLCTIFVDTVMAAISYKCILCKLCLLFAPPACTYCTYCNDFLFSHFASVQNDICIITFILHKQNSVSMYRGKVEAKALEWKRLIHSVDAEHWRRNYAFRNNIWMKYYK